MKVLIISTDTAQTHANTLAQAGFIVDQAVTLKAAEVMLDLFEYDALLAHTDTAPTTITELASFLQSQQNKLQATPVLVMTPAQESPAVTLLPPGTQHITPEQQPQLDTLLRHAIAQKEQPSNSSVTIGALSINHHARTVLLHGTPITLTAKEYLLVELLALNPGRLFTRTEILDRIWNAEYSGDGRVVDTYVKKLRQKLQVDCIETVRGMGYRLRIPTTDHTPQDDDTHQSEQQDLITLIAQALNEATDTDSALTAVHQHLQRAFGIRVMTLVNREGRLLHSATPLTDDDNHAIRAVVHAAEQSQQSGVFHTSIETTTDTGVTEQQAIAVTLSCRHDDQIARLVLLKDPHSPAWTAKDRQTLHTLAAVARPSFILHLQSSPSPNSGLAWLSPELQRDSTLISAYAQQLDQVTTLEELLDQGLQGLAALLDASACVIWQIDTDHPQVLAAHGPTGPLTLRGTLPRAANGPPEDLVRLTQVLQTRAQTAYGLSGMCRTHLLTSEPTRCMLQIFTPTVSLSDNWRVKHATACFGRALSRHLSVERLRRLAFIDELTSLRNRRAFLYDLDRDLTRAQQQNTTFQVVFLEVRPQSTASLQAPHHVQIARHVHSVFRSEDRVYTLGNGMYAALLAVPEQNAPTVLARNVTRLARLVRQHRLGQFTVNGGAVTFPTDADNLSRVLHAGFDQLHSPRPRFQTIITTA